MDKILKPVANKSNRDKDHKATTTPDQLSVSIKSGQARPGVSVVIVKTFDPSAAFQEEGKLYLPDYVPTSKSKFASTFDVVANPFIVSESVKNMHNASMFIDTAVNTLEFVEEPEDKDKMIMKIYEIIDWLRVYRTASIEMLWRCSSHVEGEALVPDKYQVKDFHLFYLEADKVLKSLMGKLSGLLEPTPPTESAKSTTDHNSEKANSSLK
ncbi:MAG: hypothetical protein P4L74_02445 [Candidatus Doudnabacteria bacterium]|nr:hypothetical protein [Candidatus Doudnabacteria bacterium]